MSGSSTLAFALDMEMDTASVKLSPGIKTVDGGGGLKQEGKTPANSIKLTAKRKASLPLLEETRIREDYRYEIQGTRYRGRTVHEVQ